MKIKRHELPELIEVPQLIIVNQEATVAPFRPTDSDLESGIILELEKNAQPLVLAGKHQFLIHTSPPLPHHPDHHKHQVYWLNAVGEKVIAWQVNSWKNLSTDTVFLDATDVHFQQMQEANPQLRMYFVYGFATQADIVKAKEYGGNISLRGSQSQYRAHIHVAEAIDENTLSQLDSTHLTWLSNGQLKQMNGQLAFLFNTAGEWSMRHYKKTLKKFGEKVRYRQEVGRNQPVAIDRTFFSFSSLSDALSAILACENEITATWLEHARTIGDVFIEFAGEMIRLIQACKPCFTCIKPSMQDKILGGIDPKVTWLVSPFTLPLPQTMFNPGILLKRVAANTQK